MDTADRADNYLRLTATVSELRRMFADYVPTDAELAKVGHAADFAFDQVVARTGVAQDAQDAEYHSAKNYLECAALYGYLLGIARSQSRENSARAA